MSKIISGGQIRMARAFLRWSVRELSEKSLVGKSTVQRIEEADGLPNARIENIQSLYDALIKTGRVRFEGETGVFMVLDE